LGNIGEGAKEKPQNPLDSFALNLNEEAKAGRIDPLIGREQEVTRLIQVLSRRRKNNPLFVGESGVGKTAIAEGLAKQIVDGQVPEILKDSVVYSLDMGALLPAPSTVAISRSASSCCWLSSPRRSMRSVH